MKLARAFPIISSILALSVFTSCQDNNRQNEAEVETEAAPETFVERQDDMITDVAVTIDGKPTLSTFASRMGTAEAEEAIEEADTSVTVFAPNNNAYSYMFRAHEADHIQGIDYNEEVLYHIVKGEFTADRLRQRIEENNGTFSLPTLEGDHLMISMANDSILVRGRTGEGATILESDLESDNGIVHIISAVILPGDVETNVQLNDQ